MCLVIFERPVSLALFTVKLDDFCKKKHHEFVGWPHLIFFETDGALIWLLLSFGELLETIFTVSGSTYRTLKDITGSRNRNASLAFIVFRLETELGLGVEVGFG